MKLFGTNGVRGIANEYMNPQLVMDIIKSLGTFMNNTGTIAIGQDTRISGDMLKAAATAGALSAGLTVIDIGICPTPSVQYYVRDNANAGIVITASHNPREYNGVKLIADDGTEMSREDEAKIENIYFSKNFKSAIWQNTGDLRHDLNANMHYINGIISVINADLIKLKKFKVIMDTGCGAGSLTLPFLLRNLGCEVITINAQIDGTFPSRNPEPTPETLTELAALVVKEKAHMGVAHDGDADRAVFFDENGNFIDEEVLLSMMAKYVLKQKKGTLVTPVSSSQRMLDVANEADVDLIWTAVGSINVARKMRDVEAVFGGEGNGGLIFPEHQYCRDGAMSCAKLLEIMTSGVKLSEMASTVPSYYNSKTKIKCSNLIQTMEHVKSEVLHNEFKTDLTDGVKIWYSDGWVLIRPSGTEPIIRIFAEAKTNEKALELMNEGVKIVEKYI